jgi:hypothetical protein
MAYFSAIPKSNATSIVGAIKAANSKAIFSAICFYTYLSAHHPTYLPTHYTANLDSISPTFTTAYQATVK